MTSSDATQAAKAAAPAMPPRLLVLRHGRSVANEKGLIASSLGNAEQSFGLTDEGRAQVLASVGAARSGIVVPVTVVSSPLLRARETADIAAEILDTDVRVDHRLIERSFGELELDCDDRYESVWTLDRRDPTHRTWKVESVVEVWARMQHLLRALPDDPDIRATPDSSVLLVSHGDVASILICGSKGQPLSHHREVGAMGTGELRAVDWPPVS